MAEALAEMATLRKADSGLPVNLYVGDSLSYQRGGHSRRIKFQTDKGDKPNAFSNFSSMDLDGNVIAKTFPKKPEISSKDIQAVRNFVKNNREALELVSDMDMQFSDFKSYFMIQGGNPADTDLFGRRRTRRYRLIWQKRKYSDISGGRYGSQLRENICAVRKRQQQGQVCQRGQMVEA